MAREADAAVAPAAPGAAPFGEDLERAVASSADPASVHSLVAVNETVAAISPVPRRRHIRTHCGSPVQGSPTKIGGRPRCRRAVSGGESRAGRGAEHRECGSARTSA